MNDSNPAFLITTDINPDVFRRACGAFATGITIVTALDQNDLPVGMTVNSFTSVSLEPPMVLWTIGNSARSAPAFLAASHYAVHILHHGQENLAALFASRSDDKFSATKWRPGTNGLPILNDYSVCMECAVEHVYPCGGQQLLVARVLRIQDHGREDALLYFRSQFRQIG